MAAMVSAGDGPDAAAPTGTSPWSRSGFSSSIKRKVRKTKGSESGSITGSNSVAGDSSSDLPHPYPSLRRNSSESTGRRLSLVLGGSKRRRSRRGGSVGASLSNSNTALDSNASSDALSPALTTGTGMGAQQASATPGGSSGSVTNTGTGTQDGGQIERVHAMGIGDLDPNSYTEDEDEGPKRPALDSRPSHLGYLTLSSPLIDAKTVARTRSSDNLSAASSSINDSSASRSGRSDSLKAPSTSQRRSPSPAGRLRDAFRPSKKNLVTADTDKGGERAGEGGSGGQIGGQGSQGDAVSKERPLPIIFRDRAIVGEPGEKTPSPKKLAGARIVTNVPSTPPPDANGPATIVTPPTPTIASSHNRNQSDSSFGSTIVAPELAHSPSGANNSRTASHRRSKSGGQPSKLSNSTIIPLTPHAEEPPKLFGSPPSGGFFSSVTSVFSAAQNAATSLTNTITSGAGAKGKSNTNVDPRRGDTGGEEVILPPGSEAKDDLSASDRKELAIDTLGSGNLSLSHLGISDLSDVSPMQSSTDLVSGMRRDEMAARVEDDAAARAVSNAYTEKVNSDRAPSLSPSVADTTEQASIRPPAEDEKSSIRRTGSVRSRLSGRRRRTRGSSAATGTTTLAPMITGPGSTAQKLTGFAVANQKRNKDFHNLFRSVPEDDFLIEDYSAALQREILLQGRIYISEGHICFSSNILGWVTNLVMSFDEIISVEKKSTALIFQNGILIQTLQAKNVFASLLNRDSTYDLMISIWKITHPNLKSSLNGAPIEGTGNGDKTEKVGSVVEEDSASEEIYDEEEDEDDEDGEGSFAEPQEGSTVASEAGEISKPTRKVSGNLIGAVTANGSAKTVEAIDSVLTGATATIDFPGPATHPPADCGDQAQHLERLLYEDTIPAPLGKIYSLMFGPASGAFMRKWLIEDQKSTDLQLEDDKKGLDNDHKSMTFSYIKPLGGSIGPKQTKCIINSTLEQFDLTKAVSVLCSTQNPDVPSGNIFVVKTRYCLSWAPNNSTKYLATCQIEWSGKSWLKGPIEKGANDGQLQYQKDIVAALKLAVTAKSVLKAGAKGRTKTGRRKKDSADPTAGTSAAISTSSKAAEANWGLFEPLRGPLGPVADLVSPSFIITFLALIILILWWCGPSSHVGAYGPLSSSGVPPHARIAAYEELWRTEESELWKWLEDRAGLDGAKPGSLSGQNHQRQDWLRDQRVREMERRLDGKKKGGAGAGGAGSGCEMGERQIREAIRVTKERLEALEVAVERNAAPPSPPPPYSSAKAAAGTEL